MNARGITAREQVPGGRDVNVASQVMEDPSLWSPHPARDDILHHQGARLGADLEGDEIFEYGLRCLFAGIEANRGSPDSS
jgi:hypothetical protein